MRSIAPLVAIVALIAGTTVAACGRGQGAPAAEYAVYAEYSLSNKPMVAGWNARVFNKKEVQEGENIGLDDRTGVVTLRAGLYHITAMSLVNSYDVANPTSIPTLSTPPAGYARLRYLEDALSPDVVPTIDVLNANNAKALSIGTGSDANALPSFMETFLRVQDKASLVVEHQVGNDVKGLYLQVNANGSIWHVNARISIQRL
ncbi:hypothetical protein AWC29_04070 [Mycobacterium triplex]|uniref:Lipoprotein n=1 Tax=Mycobacterium triplex TaxID=47839 RepID=A0ABX3VWK2_9MYCO|nr:hypothetical protein AWC29_04070 [Mycobacterium triplex]